MNETLERPFFNSSCRFLHFARKARPPAKSTLSEIRRTAPQKAQPETRAGKLLQNQCQIDWLPSFGVMPTWKASAPRPLKGPPFEAEACHA